MNYKIPRPPKVGDKYRSRRGVLFHVRAIVDLIEYQNGPSYEVVFRFWSRRRGRWIYRLEDEWAFVAIHVDGVPSMVSA